MLSEVNAKRTYNFLIFSSFFMYILFIGVKNTFTAEIALIMTVFGINKPTASMTTTYYFVTYGITQILLFFFLSKFNIKKFLIATLSVAACLMFSVGLCTGIVQIYVIYAISGFFQAGLWAGIIAVLSLYLPKSKLASANKALAVGYPVAGGISYGFSAIFNSFGNWNLPFIVLGTLAFLSVWMFYLATTRAEKIAHIDKIEVEEKKEEKTSQDEYKIFNIDTKVKRFSFYIIMLILSFLSASLYFAVIGWIPSLMKDIYSMNEATAALITMVVPLSVMFGAIIVIDLCEKYKNTMLVAMVAFAISIVFAVFLVFFYGFNMIVSLVVIIIMLNLVHGARNIFSSITTFKMRKQLNSGGFAALVNSTASIGAGVAPTIIGAVIDSAGWQVSYITVLALDVVIVSILIVLSFMVNANLKKQKLQEQN